MGIDYLSYKKIYEVIQNGEIPDDIIEPGFYWICKIIGALGLHYSFFFGFFCCLQVFFIILAFKNKPELLPWIFIVLLSSQFMVMMTLVRQMTFVLLFYMVGESDQFYIVRKVCDLDCFMYVLLS